MEGKLQHQLINLAYTTCVNNVRANWLVQKWLASTLHLVVAEETKSRVNNIITNNFWEYWQK